MATSATNGGSVLALALAAGVGLNGAGFSRALADPLQSAPTPIGECVGACALEHDFAAAAGILGDSVQTISRQAGVAILIDGHLSQTPTPGVHGRMSTGEALARLLNGVEAEVAWVSNGAIIRLQSAAREHANNDDASGLTPYDFENDPNLVRVIGYRQAQHEATEIKRTALGVQETVLAQDIADFPELNLAESLQRLPGVTITRARGEGARISLRGLGPEFTRVRINGMETLANTSRDRGFEFNVFASELFSRIDVLKTYSVGDDDGGIGGAVDLYTRDPFDFTGPAFVVAGEIGANTNAEALDQRLMTLWSNTFSSSLGDFGLAASAALSNRVSEGQDASTYRYRASPIVGADLSALPIAQQQALEAGEIYIPRGNRYRVSREDQLRTGITLNAQWRPSPEWLFSLRGLYSAFSVDRRANNLQTRGSDSFPIASQTIVDGVSYGPTSVLALSVNDMNELEYAAFENANIGSESTITQDDVQFAQTTLGVQFQPSDTLELSALFGYARSEFDQREDKFYLETFDALTLDYRGVHRLDPLFDYGGAKGLVDAEQWRAHEIDLLDADSVLDNALARVDARIATPFGAHLKAGASFKRFSSDGGEYSAANLLRDAFASGAVDDNIGALAEPITDHYGAQWIGVNVDEALAYYNVNGTFASADPASNYAISETIAAVYGGAVFEGALVGVAARAELGVRYVQTRRTASGSALVLNESNNSAETLSFKRTSAAWLPAATLRLEPLPGTYLRASLSRNQTSPSLEALNPSVTLRTINFQDAIIGNPSLSPYTATNFELYLERYHAFGYASIGYFRKDVSDFISQTARVSAFRNLGLPDSVLEPGQTPDTPFTVVSYQNTQDTRIEGIEIAASQEFGFLPAPWSDFSITANYTYADGSFQYFSIADGSFVRAAFPGLSRHSANVTLIYETINFGGRIAVAHRGDYVATVEPGLSDEDSRGVLGATFVDFAGYWQASPEMQLTLDVLNLTGEVEHEYSDSSHRLTERRESGVTALIGARLTF